MRTTQLIGIGAVIFACACESQGTALSDEERTTIAASVDSAMRAFQAAERARDAEQVIAHMAPDFYMYNDGVRIDYNTTASQIRATMPTLQHFEPGFADIEVKVLGWHGAVVSLTFVDSLVDRSGATMQFRGPTTMVWERRGVDWLITYVDADHYVEPLL